MDFILDPPKGVGDLQIGMTRDATGKALLQFGTPTPFARRGDRPGWCVERPATIFTYCDENDCTDAIEFATPGRRGKDRVLFQGIDLFRTPASDAVAQLESLGIEVTEEEAGYSFIAKNLLLALWRDGGPSDGNGMPKYFESALVARPGYDGGAPII